MEGTSGKAKARKQRQNKFKNKDHIFRKRQSQKPELGKSVIYVSTKTPTKVISDICALFS